MIRIVLDTNALVSGLLSPADPPGRIVDLVTRRQIHIVYCDEILIEYIDVLSRRELRIRPDAADSLLGEIRNRGTNVAVGPWPLSVPDESDSIFLCTASEGDAVLITGNLRHYPPKVRLDVEVATPRDFVDKYRTNFSPSHKRSEGPH